MGANREDNNKPASITSMSSSVMEPGHSQSTSADCSMENKLEQVFWMVCKSPDVLFSKKAKPGFTAPETCSQISSLFEDDDPFITIVLSEKQGRGRAFQVLYFASDDGIGADLQLLPLLGIKKTKQPIESEHTVV